MKRVPHPLRSSKGAGLLSLIGNQARVDLRILEIGIAVRSFLRRELTGLSQEEIGHSEPIVQFMPSGVDNDGLSDDEEGKHVKIDRMDPAVDD